MGWIAYFKDGRVLTEEKDGRPVQAGEEGELLAIAQEDFHHRVCIDLVHGIIFLDYDSIGQQNGTLEITGWNTMLYICDDTNVVGELFHVDKGEPDAEGWYSQEVRPLVWRPIWFTRYTNNVPAKIIGAQTTLPDVYGGHNVKKMVTLFSDGRMGIF
jgi:hypothetical protein